MTNDARGYVADPANAVIVSSASAWEIAIKQAPGKVNIAADLGGAMAGCGFETLTITFEHALEAGTLLPIHRDPFDA